jgi:hypothetical protein
VLARPYWPPPCPRAHKSLPAPGPVRTVRGAGSDFPLRSCPSYRLAAATQGASRRPHVRDHLCSVAPRRSRIGTGRRELFALEPSACRRLRRETPGDSQSDLLRTLRWHAYHYPSSGVAPTIPYTAGRLSAEAVARRNPAHLTFEFSRRSAVRSASLLAGVVGWQRKARTDFGVGDVR